MNRFIVLCFFLTFSAASFSQESQQQAAATGSKPSVYVYKKTARPADQIEYEYPYNILLKTADGDTVNSAEVFSTKKKPTILVFWLTTCVPCRYEMKAIAEKYEGWKKEADFNLYAISIDFPKNYEQFVKRVKESGWTFPAYNDVNREFPIVMPGQLNGLPQTFVLDKDGKIVHHEQKYSSGDEDVLFGLVKKM